VRRLPATDDNFKHLNRSKTNQEVTYAAVKVESAGWLLPGSGSVCACMGRETSAGGGFRR
jgi:hypothetical protein